jgi:hypothetical protein
MSKSAISLVASLVVIFAVVYVAGKAWKKA